MSRTGWHRRIPSLSKRVYTHRVQVRHLVLVLPLGIVLATGCSRSSPAAPSPAAPSNVVNAMQGNWRSIDTASTGSCSNTTFSVTRTGAGTASVTFGASCGASSISVYAVGSVSSDALVWEPEYVGTLSFGPGDIRCGGLPQARGTARPLDESTATLTYSGTLCGAPIGGSVTLSRMGS